VLAEQPQLTRLGDRLVREIGRVVLDDLASVRAREELLEFGRVEPRERHVDAREFEV
jgi:hypothetical protein